MVDGSLASLQKGIVLHLKSKPAVIALINPLAPRIYYRIPKTDNVVFPYIKIGVMEETIEDFGCGQHFNIRVTLHVFNRNTEVQTLKNLAELVRDALLEESMSVLPFTLEDTRFNTLRSLTDPDGLTEHAVLEFTFTLSPP